MTSPSDRVVNTKDAIKPMRKLRETLDLRIGEIDEKSFVFGLQAGLLALSYLGGKKPLAQYLDTVLLDKTEGALRDDTVVTNLAFAAVNSILDRADLYGSK